MAELKRIITLKKKCVQCGNEFTTDKLRRLYCSAKCSGKYTAKRNTARLHEMNPSEFIKRELDVPLAISEVSSVSMRFMVGNDPYIIVKLGEIRRLGLDIQDGSVVDVVVSVALK